MCPGAGGDPAFVADVGLGVILDGGLGAGLSVGLGVGLGGGLGGGGIPS